MTRGPRCCVVAVALLFAGPAMAQDVAVLQGLDKVTARISTIDAPIGDRIRFGTLSIVVRHCRKTPPEEPPETTAFLEIDDIRPGEQPVRLFSGWMFASSPALSALEHPVYDVWVVGCKRSSTSPTYGRRCLGRARSRSKSAMASSGCARSWISTALWTKGMPSASASIGEG